MMTQTPTRVALGLGSNMGNSRENLEMAVRHLDATSGITVVARSSVYRTPPWGPIPQDDYSNMCITIDTMLKPRALLERGLAIEARMGRIRDERWGPRLIDIDILLYGTEKIDKDGLIVPHPRMSERAFVLIPLTEIWPDAPLGDGRTAAQALETCPDKDGVVKLDD